MSKEDFFSSLIWDYSRKGGNLKGACVNLKLVEGETLRDRISSASNAQTAMEDWDFVFNDPIQKRLQHEFAQLHPQVFYQLRRGEYKYMSAVSGDSELVTVKDIAQTAWAFMGHPAEAKDRLREVPQSRTANTGIYQQVFFEESTASFFVLPWRVYQEVKRKHEEYVTETNIQGDFREFGRLHLVWLVGRGLLKLLGKNDAKEIKPQEALNLVKGIQTWFDILHRVGVETLQEVYKVERKACDKVGEKPVSLRQLFRNEKYYTDFEATHDEEWSSHKNDLDSLKSNLLKIVLSG